MIILPSHLHGHVVVKVLYRIHLPAHPPFALCGHRFRANGSHHSIENDYSLSELGTCTVRVGLMSGLHYAFQRVPKTRTHSVPVPSRVPALRQHILTITVRH